MSCFISFLMTTCCSEKRQSIIQKHTKNYKKSKFIDNLNQFMFIHIHTIIFKNKLFITKTFLFTHK